MSEVRVFGGGRHFAPWLAFGVLVVLIATALVPAAGFSGPSTLAAPHHPNALTFSTLPAAPATQAKAHPDAAPSPLTSTATAASPAWTNLTATAGIAPPYRSYGRSMAYDPVDGYVLMFGGYTGAYLNDTWTFHNGTWKQLQPRHTPPGRDHSTLAWDAADGYLLMFGGSGYGGSYNDTWTFLNGDWKQLHPHSAPSARWASTLAYDALDRELVLFGGCSGAAIGDTWTFSAGNWTLLHPSVSPDSRQNANLVYDWADHYVLLFGGSDWSGGSYGDTWSFHGGNWTQIPTTTSPANRSMAGAAWDTATNSVILFAGQTSAGTPNDTWSYVGGAWTKLNSSVAPEGRYFAIMSDDPADHAVLMFSGTGNNSFDDTWALYALNLTATVTPNQGPTPVAITATANVTGGFSPYRYSWDFGDLTQGNTSTANHTYDLPGVYLIHILVTDSRAASVHSTLAVRAIVPLAVLALANTTSGIAPLSVGFSSQVIGGMTPYTYSWTMAPGVTSILPDPTVTYLNPANYTVSVVVSDASGQQVTRSFVVNVRSIPVPPLLVDASATPVSGPAPLVVGFSVLSSGGVPPLTQSWTFGDKNSSTSNNPSHVYTAAGTDVATVTVRDSAGHSTVQSVSITVGAPIQIAGVTSPSTSVAGKLASFSVSATGGTMPYRVEWDFGDGSGAIGASATHAFAAASDYTVVVTVIDATGASATTSTTITISAATHPPPTTTTTNNGGSSGPLGAISSPWGMLAVGLAVGAIATAGVFWAARPSVRRR